MLLSSLARGVLCDDDDEIDDADDADDMEKKDENEEKGEKKSAMLGLRSQHLCDTPLLFELVNTELNLLPCWLLFVFLFLSC